MNTNKSVSFAYRLKFFMILFIYILFALRLSRDLKYRNLFNICTRMYLSKLKLRFKFVVFWNNI